MSNQEMQLTSPDAEYSTETERYLTFILGDEEYGVQITKVKTIIGILPITKVPHSPMQIVGVINLRGIIIPVVDLRIRFEIPQTEYGRDATIVVCEVLFEDKSEQMGFLVDMVTEVTDISYSDVEQTPDIGLDVRSEYFIGIAHLDKRVITLIDIQKVLYHKVNTVTAEAGY